MQAAAMHAQAKSTTTNCTIATVRAAVTNMTKKVACGENKKINLALASVS
jgi:hypothetical protein